MINELNKTPSIEKACTFFECLLALDIDDFNCNGIEYTTIDLMNDDTFGLQARARILPDPSEPEVLHIVGNDKLIIPNNY